MRLSGNLFRWVVGALTLGVAILLIAQVFFRYVLNNSVSWIEEVSSFTMIWAGLLGAATLARHDQYISFSLLKDSEHAWIRRSARAISAMASVVFGVLILYYGVAVSFLSPFSPTSSAAAIPLSWVYAVFPIAGALIVAGALMRLWDIKESRDE